MAPFSAPLFICRNCLQHLRFPRRRPTPSPSPRQPQPQPRQIPRVFSTANPPLPTLSTPSFAHLTTRRLISLSGPDAAHFLQGLTTVNITSSSSPNVKAHQSQDTASSRRRGGGFYSAFLNASGRVLYDAFIYPTAMRQPSHLDDEEGSFLIEVDAKEAETLAKHLKRFKLRAKIAIRVLDQAQWGVFAAWGGRSTDTDAGTDIDPDARTRGVEEKVVGHAIDSRAPEMGRRYILERGQPTAEAEVLARLYDQPMEEVGVSSYDIRRMMMGVAEGQAEILRESALPQESNIDYMGGIDFRKGCYVGQELTIRTHHTGVVRKRILPVQLYGDPADGEQQQKQPEKLAYDTSSILALPLLQGANISRADKKGRSAGKWLGGVGNIGLALCRLEVMTDTVLTSEGSQWKPENEFKITWEADDNGSEGGEVKIKAFIPDWHEARAEKLKVRHG